MQDNKSTRQTPKVISRTNMAQGKWLRLDVLEYQDCHGAIRKWEAAFRQGEAGSVLMIPWLRPSNRVVLIEQYRPALNGYALEFPAGLIEPGEAPESAAIRELREETGFHGKLTWISRPGLNTPGMTSEATRIAVIEINENLPENQNPEHTPEPGEDITVHLLAAPDIPAFAAVKEQAGVRVDTRIIAYFMAPRQPSLQ